ncbi:MAG: LuxR C-terminal-related transcriptional regulator [Gammaproteobacteria bacterium]|nr:LuxR C-terminal-related transcriptional regulator [Gammaproteobacteria bacterium]
MRGAAAYGMCLAHGLNAEFDAALKHAALARAQLGRRSSYFTMHIDLQTGLIAMAQGRVAEADRCYARAQRVARTQFLRDPSAVAHADVLAKELELERHRTGQVGAALQTAKGLGGYSTPYFAYAAASGLVAELSLSIGGVESALAALDEIREHAYGEHLPALSRCLAALRVGTLAGAGDVGEAERTWLLAELPENQDGCLDLTSQSWREMEALSCARLRLFVAREEYDEARDFAAAVTSVATQRGLRRTWMRVTAQQMDLEHRAGQMKAALACLEEFLGVFRETDYLRPLVRESESSVAVLTSYLDSESAGDSQALAKTLLDAVGRSDGRLNGPPDLTPREAEILVRLAEYRDREIADALGLTRSGVRYHVTNILAKLSARSRMDAVHRARRLGLLP